MSEISNRQLDPAAIAALGHASQRAELALSPDLTIVACNEAYSRLQGIPASTLIGRPVRQVFREDTSLELLIASFESVLRLRRADRMTAPIPAPADGESLAGQSPTAFCIFNIPVLASDGAVQWILHSLDAVPGGSERSTMAMALEAAEAKLRSVLQTVPDAMIIIDDRGRIESLSTTAELLFGYSLDEIAGSISDTSSGLAPEVASHLFQPFVTTKRKGMGLGLSISRTIVESHGGKIWVEERPGGGTAFRFTLRSAETEEADNAG